jgi:4-hydroxy-4-methyl-2-oxoglutarate aldolase
MNGTVVRNIHRADATALAALERPGVATVHEAQGRSGLMRPDVRPALSEKGLKYVDGPLE